MLSKLIKASVAICVSMLVSVAAQAQSYDFVLLAASWQPGFCVTHSSKPECQNLKGTYAATHLALHGLWPNAYDGNHPQYCNVPQKDIDLDASSAWCSMDSYGASSSTLSVLSTYMPGVQSCLDKHEWFKHGSCSTKTADNYWGDASSLSNRLGQTALNTLIANNIGKTLSRSQLLAAANTSFGSSGSSAVSLKCTKTNGVSYLTEVWVNLNKNNLSQFPASTSLVTNANVAGTCPSTNIFIAKP